MCVPMYRSLYVTDDFLFIMVVNTVLPLIITFLRSEYSVYF
jgi:hypothetical protein